jgi:Ca-activated chloride channel homolog
MKPKKWLFILLSLFQVLALGGMFVTPARADGIIIPDPCPECPPVPSPMSQLVIRYHHVDVTIDDQVVLTHVDQVFYNPNDRPIEGTYLFPLPVDAAVNAFTLWVDGEPVEGRVLEAGQARQQYEQIVASLRDPALLEYAGRGAVQARIFPIPPQGERRIELEYTQVLTADEGLVRYIYPLSTEKFSALPLEEVTIRVEVSSSVPLRLAYSPSHPVDIQRSSDTSLVASYEAANVLPDADFALYYSLGEAQAFHLLSYRDASESADPDGFFLVLLAPQPQAESQALPKDLIIVLDHSGSMEGEKFSQAQQAVSYILDHLNPEDAFNLVTFSSGVELYASGMRPAGEAAEAREWIQRLSAAGSTDIQRALLEAAASTRAERPTYVIFLTDGLPTEGVVDNEQILKDFAEAAGDDLRLFTFGVGYDVDTYLLDSLAQEHHGASFYVQPGERLDEALSTFYAKISTPVLMDLQLDFGDLSVYDLYPSPLPDLFRGSQIVAVGRYRQGGMTDVRLSGQVNDSEQVFVYKDQQFSQASAGDDPLASLLPRLWATRKIGYLLNQVRLNGADQETVEQIVRLSIRYGIVTPYTSYLVTEELPLGEAAQEQIVEREVEVLSAPQEASGQEAVQKAADQGSMAAAEAPVLEYSNPGSSGQGATTGRIVSSAGSHSFVLKDSTWIDTLYDPETMTTVKVAFLSDDYFALADADANLRLAFALGQSIIAISGDKVYEVVAEGSRVEPIELPEPEPTSEVDTTLKAGLTAENATPAPIAEVAVEEPAQPRQPAETSQPGGLPCLGGLLPGLLLGGVWIGLRWARTGKKLNR